MMARFIAMRLSGVTTVQGGAGGAQRPPGATGGLSGAGAPGGPGGSGGPPRTGDMQQMIERMPAIKLTDLKAGDAVIVSSTQGADPGQVTAITLVAGVEPILSAAPGGSQRAAMLGSWNLDMGGGMGEQQ
jgi:hypothetical protein